MTSIVSPVGAWSLNGPFRVPQCRHLNVTFVCSISITHVPCVLPTNQHIITRPLCTVKIDKYIKLNKSYNQAIAIAGKLRNGSVRRKECSEDGELEAP